MRVSLEWYKCFIVLAEVIAGDAYYLQHPKRNVMQVV